MRHADRAAGPRGFRAGAVGFLISIGGLVAAGRPGVTGRGLAVLGLVCGLAAVWLAVAAMSGRFSWPNSRTDEITQWRAVTLRVRSVT